jgi:hypothetical protein
MNRLPIELLENIVQKIDGKLAPLANPEQSSVYNFDSFMFAAASIP